MTAVYVSPGDVAASLGVSGSTFRRISADYESVYGALPRDGNNRRIWSLDAVQVVQQAHEAVRDGRADSTRAALEALHAGRDLPARADPPAPGAGALDVVTGQLGDLAQQIRDQGEGFTQLLRTLDERDAEIAGALRALGDAQLRQAEQLTQLSELITASARPAPAPVAQRERGLLAALRALFGI